MKLKASTHESKRLDGARNPEAYLKSSCKSEFREIQWVRNNLNKENLPVEIIEMTRVGKKGLVYPEYSSCFLLAMPFFIFCGVRLFQLLSIFAYTHVLSYP